MERTWVFFIRCDGVDVDAAAARIGGGGKEKPYCECSVPMLLLLQLPMLPRVVVTSSCRSSVMFEAGIGKMEDELLNLLFLDEGEEEEGMLMMSGEDELPVMWFSTVLP